MNKKEIYHIAIMPSGHGQYKVNVEMHDGNELTIQVTDMELIDEWKDGNREPLKSYILNTI